MVGANIFIGNVTLENFLIFLFIFLLTVIIANISYALMRRLLDDKLSLGNSKLIARIIEYAFYTLGFYYGVLYVLKMDLSALIASLGIFTIALAFGAQQIIQNFIAGVLISILRPIELDDWVEISDTGISNIKEIKLTRTVLRNRNGKLFFVPNSVLVSTIIINYTKSGFVEIPVPLSISYSCDFEKVKNIVKEVAQGHPKILPNVSRREKDIISKLFELSNFKILFKDKMDMRMFEPGVLISDISDSKITLSLRIWIREIDKKDEIVSEFLEKLMTKFKVEKIELSGTPSKILSHTGQELMPQNQMPH
ncbi:MAG: mechanosensitive ion channel [Candidatus Methanoperedens sp.]|nr:mechanosensitive ion channel [Candidatus Methanoperedens sp.]CAG0948485.1 Small-conductance mechanosensitive channel [Methanosarcinales archaeon]